MNMNRRSFIQKSILVSGALLAFKSTALYALNGTRSTALNALTGTGNITGKVSAAGQPLSDVLISDGFSVVKTDNNGSYSLGTNAKAEFVFISIPSGYIFPEENKVARFYHPLKDGRSFDFDLKPLKKDDNEHSFIIWADPQVKDDNDVKQMLSQSVPDVQQLVRDLGEGELIHGIGVGDLVWDNHALIPSYKEAVAEMGIPFFQALGNHDMDYRLGGDETSDRTFKKHYGPTYYSFNRGKAHYVILDDVRYLGTERDYDGFITQQQLDWLAEDLKHVSSDKLVILCMHIPVDTGVKNNQDLYALLAPFSNAHIMSGHTHFNRNTITHNVYEHNHGTVCGSWWTGPICQDGTPRGYGVYRVEGNTLKWYYKSIGRSRSEQMKLYADEVTNQKRVTANVWNWDPEWKIEYWADNKYMGRMENQEGFDPLSVKLYLGDKLPVTRTFVEPAKSDHIFVALVGSEIKKVKVIATDRFGEKYESEVEI